MIEGSKFLIFEIFVFNKVFEMFLARRNYTHIGRMKARVIISFLILRL